MLPVMLPSMASTDERAWVSEHGAADVQEAPLPVGDTKRVVVEAALAAVGMTAMAQAAAVADAVTSAVLTVTGRGRPARSRGVDVIVFLFLRAWVMCVVELPCRTSLRVRRPRGAVQAPDSSLRCQISGRSSQRLPVGDCGQGSWQGSVNVHQRCDSGSAFMVARSASKSSPWYS